MSLKSPARGRMARIWHPDKGLRIKLLLLRQTMQSLTGLEKPWLKLLHTGSRLKTRGGEPLIAWSHLKQRKASSIEQAL